MNLPHNFRESLPPRCRQHWSIVPRQWKDDEQAGQGNRSVETSLDLQGTVCSKSRSRRQTSCLNKRSCAGLNMIGRPLRCYFEATHLRLCLWLWLLSCHKSLATKMLGDGGALCRRMIVLVVGVADAVWWKCCDAVILGSFEREPTTKICDDRRINVNDCTGYPPSCRSGLEVTCACIHRPV